MVLELELHRPTEQILLGNQVHLYQGNFIVQLSKFCLVIVLYQGGARTWGEVRPPSWYKTITKQNLLPKITKQNMLGWTMNL